MSFQTLSLSFPPSIVDQHQWLSQVLTFTFTYIGESYLSSTIAKSNEVRQSFF